MILIFIINLFENSLLPDYSINIPKFNPADYIDQRTSFSAGGEEKFGLSEMRTWSLNLRYRQFKLNLATFGNELYRENVLEIAGGFLVHKTLTSGIGIAILNNWIKEHANRYIYSIKFGSTFSAPNCKFVLCLNNINYPKFSEIDYLPLSYFGGLNYNLNRQFSPFIYIMGKQIERPFLKTGFFIKPANLFEFLIAVNTENFLFEYGVRIHLSRISFDYTGTNHRQLGLTHAFFINFLKI